MAFRQKRRYNKNPQRRKLSGIGAQNQTARRTPIGIVSCDGTLAVVTVVFDQPVILSGLPGWTDSADNTVISAEMTGPTTCEMTFSDTAVTPLTIPFEDPAFRNSAGGYVRTPSQVLG